MTQDTPDTPDTPSLPGWAPASQHEARVAPGKDDNGAECWLWVVTVKLTGRVIATGTAPSKKGALRDAERYL